MLLQRLDEPGPQELGSGRQTPANPAYSLMPENFPKHVRAGYLASAYAVAVSVFGGTSQLVVAWLIKATGNTMAPAWYMIGCVIVSLIAVSMLEETGGRDLDAG